MNEITDLDYRRQIGDCFYLEIPLNSSIEEIQTRISHATCVEQAVKKMLDGTVDIEEMIEEIEPVILDFGDSIDEYLEIVEENMEYVLPLLMQQSSKYVV